MNALRTWRKANKLTIEQVAASVGTSTGSLSRIERGEQWPDPDFFRRVIAVTAGAVTPNDFLGVTPSSPADHSE